jgi:hypothetical protein
MYICIYILYNIRVVKGWKIDNELLYPLVTSSMDIAGKCPRGMEVRSFPADHV